MPDTRVMVVDDSAAMRALFCGILENAKGVEVCGVANDAADARSKLDTCLPDVLTLDVEMPGMSGMDFLAEIMEERPMPVIMLSSIAQAGSGVAQQAMELGAVHCFPKPLHSSPEEFDATVAKLGDIVIRAHNGTLDEAAGDDGEVVSAEEPVEEAQASGNSFAHYQSDGSLLVIACGQAGLASAMATVSAFPAACPPTVIVVDGDPGVVSEAITQTSAKSACNVVAASDGIELTPGTVVIAFDRMNHVVVEGGPPPRLRCVARDPVGGIRPCADLLFGSIARARLTATGGLLPGTGSDGAKGLQILLQIGGKAFVETPGEGAPADRHNALRALGVAAEPLNCNGLAAWVLDATAKA
ncbi:MAG: chemotaxis protein CheB [Pseudomonadota bacterium]